MTRRQLAADQRRHGAQLDDGLGDPAARVLPEAGAQFVEFLHGGPRADHDALAAGPVDGLDDEFVESVEHLFAVVLVLHPPGVDVGQDRLLRQVITDEIGHVGVDELVVGDAVADRVGDGDIAATGRVQQAGHAEYRIPFEMNRIDEIVVDPAVDHVHRQEAVGGAHADPSGLCDEVASFDEADTHQTSEQGVLEVGRVVGARRKHDHARIADTGRSTGAQGGEQLAGVLRDRANSVVREGFRQTGGHRAPVRHDVGDTGGNADVVLQHPEIALRVPDEVDAGDVHANAGRRVDALRGAQEVRAAGDDATRDHAVVEDLALSVDVTQECLECANPLRHTGFDVRPGLVVDQTGNDVDRERPLLATDVERDALVEIRVREVVGSRTHVVRGQPFDLTPELDIRRARGGVLGVHLVVGVGAVPVRLEDPFHACEPSAVWLPPCFSATFVLPQWRRARRGFSPQAPPGAIGRRRAPRRGRVPDRRRCACVCRPPPRRRRRILGRQ